MRHASRLMADCCRNSSSRESKNLSPDILVPFSATAIVATSDSHGEAHGWHWLRCGITMRCLPAECLNDASSSPPQKARVNTEVLHECTQDRTPGGCRVHGHWDVARSEDQGHRRPGRARSGHYRHAVDPDLPAIRQVRGARDHHRQRRPVGEGRNPAHAAPARDCRAARTFQ